MQPRTRNNNNRRNPEVGGSKILIIIMNVEHIISSVAIIIKDTKLRSDKINSGKEVKIIIKNYIYKVHASLFLEPLPTY